MIIYFLIIALYVSIFKCYDRPLIQDDDSKLFYKTLPWRKDNSRLKTS